MTQMPCPHGLFAAGECPRCWAPIHQSYTSRTVLMLIAIICLAITAIDMAFQPGWAPVIQGLAVFAIVAGAFRVVCMFFTWTTTDDDTEEIR